MFTTPQYVVSALHSFDQLLRNSLSAANSLIDEDPFLRSLPSTCERDRFAYYLVVAGLDLIYTKSIIRFGPGSKESKRIARALRKEFEGKINKHLMHNLEGLEKFLKDESIHLAHGLLPRDLHGAWVVMAYEMSRSLDFSREDVKDSARHVTDWLESAIGEVF